MTDTTAALTPVDLGQFEGRDILSATISVTNAGDGLSDAMKVEPEIMHLGDVVYVVLECEVAKVRYDPIKDTQGLARVHVLRAGTATLIDGGAVEEALDAQRVKIERARDAAAGIAKLPIGEELVLQHGEGAHAGGLVDGCDVCDAERKSAEAGD